MTKKQKFQLIRDWVVMLVVSFSIIGYNVTVQAKNLHQNNDKHKSSPAMPNPPSQPAPKPPCTNFVVTEHPKRGKHCTVTPTPAPTPAPTPTPEPTPAPTPAPSPTPTPAPETTTALTVDKTANVTPNPATSSTECWGKC